MIETAAVCSPFPRTSKARTVSYHGTQHDELVELGTNAAAACLQEYCTSQIGFAVELREVILRPAGRVTRFDDPQAREYDPKPWMPSVKRTMIPADQPFGLPPPTLPPPPGCIMAVQATQH